MLQVYHAKKKEVFVYYNVEIWQVAAANWVGSA